MSREIERDLFASLMRLSARERAEILEFLGQSSVASGAVLKQAGSRRTDPPRQRQTRAFEASAFGTDLPLTQ